MARKALIVKTQRRNRSVFHALVDGRHPNFGTRNYSRCPLCGRRHGYMRKMQMCRICFREYADKGMIVGIKKSSW